MNDYIDTAMLIFLVGHQFWLHYRIGRLEGAINGKGGGGCVERNKGANI